MKASPSLFLLAAAALQPSLQAGDELWPGWLGPERNGRVEGFKPPAQWPAELKPKMERGRSVPDTGSPLVVGRERSFVHSRQGDNEMVRSP